MLLPMLAAITLSASAASSSAVTLGWTGASGAVTIERKAAGTPWPAAPSAPLASPSGSSYTDQAIEAFSTYTYRVKAGAAVSNEITVGPPPVGMSQVLRMPAALLSTNTGSFAAITRMTFDSNGDPLLAYVTTDANGDGDNSDGQLFTISWNRASYKWNDAVKVDEVGAVPNAGSNIAMSLARDAQTGTFGMLYLMGGSHELRYATSLNGATWTHTTVRKASDDAAGFSSPALAMAGGRIHAAYANGEDSLAYRSGAVSDAPSAWTTTLAPHPAGTKRYTQGCVTLVLDAANKPAVGFCTPPEEAYNTSVFVWRVGNGAPVKVMDSNNHQNDDPSLALAERGSTIAAIFGGARDDKFFNDHHFWGSVSRDGGATWTAPSVLADDGGHSMSSPLTVGVHASNKFSAAAHVGGGSEGANKCGQPKVMRSETGAAWTTCAPDSKGLGDTANASSTVLGVAGNDKLYVAFRMAGTSAGLAPGLVLWRER